MEHDTCTGCYWEEICTFSEPNGCYESDKYENTDDEANYINCLNERQCNYRKVMFEMI